MAEEARYTIAPSDIDAATAWMISEGATVSEWEESFHRPVDDVEWIPERLSVRALLLRVVLSDAPTWEVAERTYPRGCEEGGMVEHLAATFHQESPARAFLTGSEEVLRWTCTAHDLRRDDGALLLQVGEIGGTRLGLLTVSAATHAKTHELAALIPGKRAEVADGPGWVLWQAQHAA